MKNAITQKQAACVHYQTRILNADGTIFRERAFKKNLILDQGLNQVASTQWVGAFRYAVLGGGTSPTSRDSGVVTVTLAGGVLTASAGFWDASDVGRLFKADSGEEVYISGYTSPTVAATLSGLSFTAEEGTVWYVNDTSMDNELSRTGNYTAGGANNGSTWANPTITHKRTFIFPAVGGSTTYREIGWSPSASAGANIFGRDLIPGGGDTLSTGQQYQVVCRLQITLSPVTITPATNVGGAFDTTGDYNFQALFGGTGFSQIDTNGNHISGTPGSLEPMMENVACSTEPTTFTLLSAPTDGAHGGSGGNTVAGTVAGYSSGTFTRTAAFVFSIAISNYDVFGFSFGAGNSRCLSQLFDAEQTKANTHSLTITLRVSWGRTLTN